MLSKTESDAQKEKADSFAVRNILVFHKLTDRLTFGSNNYSPDRFTSLLEKLIEAAYKFVSLDEAAETPHPKSTAITIDDGYAHLMQVLPSLIEKFNLKPTIFIPTAFIGRDNNWDYSSAFRSERHLDKFQIHELASLGVQFGSHGHSHIDLTGCNINTLKDELSKSKAILENITGQAVNAFSYPFGRLNKTVSALVKEFGYRHACTMNFPNQSDDLLRFGRIPIYFFDSASMIRQKLNGGAGRTIHMQIGRFINTLAYGTILLNKLKGRDGN